MWITSRAAGSRCRQIPAFPPSRCRERGTGQPVSNLFPPANALSPGAGHAPLPRRLPGNVGTIVLGFVLGHFLLAGAPRVRAAAPGFADGVASLGDVARPAIVVARGPVRPSVSIERLEDPRPWAFPPPGDPERSAEKEALREQFLGAREALDHGKLDQAEWLLTPLLETYPALRPYVLRDLGRILLGRGGLHGPAAVAAPAVLDLADRMDAEPGSVQAGWSAYLRGRALLSLGRAEEAEAALSVAWSARFSPGPGEVLYHLGRACELAGRPDDAYRYYRLSAESAPEVIARRATASADRIAPGLTSQEKAVDWEVTCEDLSRRVSRRRVQESLLEELDAGLEACDIPWCRRTLLRLKGKALLKLDRMEEAEPLLEAVLKEEVAAGRPAWETVALWQKTLARKGKREARRALLERFVAAGPGPDGVRAYLILAAMSANDGDSRRAEGYYRGVMARFPGTEAARDAHWRLVWAHVRQNDPIRARRVLLERLRAVEVGSEEEAQARYWLARTLEAFQQPERAAAVLDDVRYRFRGTYYGVMAAWRLDEGFPVVRKRAPVPPPRQDGPYPGDSPAELGIDLLFPGFADRVGEIDAAGPRVLLERAKELWLMGLQTEARLELLEATRQADAPAQVLWIAAALRFAMGSMYYGNWYAHRYVRTVDGDAEIPDTLLALAYPFPYRQAIVKRSLERGLEPALVAAVILQESTFRPVIRSPAGARGLMQIMPYTGREICGWLKIRHFRTRFLDEPDFNLRLGTAYLRAMLERFDDSLVRALASYNAGPEAVARWTKRQRRGLDDDMFVEEIPYRETRDYVRKVVRNLGGYLATYGSYLSGERKARPSSRTAMR